MRKFISVAAAIVAATSSVPAMAELSPQYLTLLNDAIASGNEADIATLAKYLRQASPADAAQIDSILAARSAEIAAAREAKLNDAGFFDNWKGEGQAGAYLSTGNSKTSGVTVGLGLTKEGVRWRYNFRALADYQRNNGVTSRNQMLIALEPNYKFNDRLFAFGLAQYEKDRFQGYTSRETLGGGLGYRVIADENMTLDLKAGPTWRHTNFIIGPKNSKLDALAAANFAWQITPALKLTENASAYIGSGNKSLMSLTALDAKLGGAFSARVSYQVNYESNPPLGLEKTDTLSRLTLVYGF